MKPQKKLTMQGRVKNSFLAKILDYIVLPLFGSKKFNAIMQSVDGKTGKDLIRGIVQKIGVVIEDIKNSSRHIPLDGPVTVAGNHPGGCDVFAYAYTCLSRRPDTKILVNENLYFEANKDMVIPVPSGKNKKHVFEKIAASYDKKSVVVFNPAGQNARYINKQLKDPTWKNTFLSYALRHKTPLVMFYVTGRNHRWWYWLAWLREKLGIKMRIEAFFMMWNFVYPPENKIKITFSKAIEHDTVVKIVDEHGKIVVTSMLYDYVHDTHCRTSFEEYYNKLKN